MTPASWHSARRLRAIAAIALLVASAACADDDPRSAARVAVATNFAETARELVAAFEETSGHRIELSFGSTGQLYTQITQGAPFDLLLAADRDRPARLVERGLASAAGHTTYAIGRLVLYSRDPAQAVGSDALADGRFAHLAIANPVTAPYGAAAVEALRSLGLYGRLESRLVLGANVGQTYQFVYTGAAELGFVALSQVSDQPEQSRWIVPSELYSPIRQDAVLLSRAVQHPAALAFSRFLSSKAARAIIERSGYTAPSE